MNGGKQDNSMNNNRDDTVMEACPIWKTLLTNQPDKIDNNRMNSLRAAVLGVNDDIVSITGFLVGNDSGTPSALLIAGLSALITSAFSIVGGEYSSVAAQRDAERAAGVNEANPWRAAISLFLSFVVGILIIILIALSITGWLVMRVGGMRGREIVKPIIRNALIGMLTMGFACWMKT